MYLRVPRLDNIKAAIGWQPTLSLDHTLDEIIAHFRDSAYQEETRRLAGAGFLSSWLRSESVSAALR
jgi:hypothetical protein